MRSIFNRTVSIISAIIIATTSLSGTVGATTGSQVYGSLKTDVSPGAGQGLYSTQGSVVTIKDSTGNLLAQTTNGEYGFILNNVPDGYSHVLEVQPPSNNPGSLLPYSMDLDVFGDTYLVDSNNTGILTMHSADTMPTDNNVVFSGRMLFDGNPYIATGKWGRLFIVNYAKSFSKALNASTSNDPTFAATFDINVPKDSNYVLWQEEAGDFLSNNRGIRNMSPSMTLSRDSYRVFNINTAYNAADHSIKVIDQCGVPFPGVEIRGYQASTVSIRDSTTATVKHTINANGPTNANGITTLSTQSTGDSVNLGQGIALRLSALNPNSNEFVLIKDLLVPYPLAQSITIPVSVPFHTCSDLIPPNISASHMPIAGPSGWNNSDVTVNYTCSDSESGVVSCPSPTILNTDGINQSATGTAVDNAGNTNTTTISGINIDKTKPTATNPTISGWLVVNWGNPVISANASDALSGVTSGEYYIDNDPGQGNGSAMTYANGKITAQPVITTGTANGWHTIYMRSKDAAGNWSTPTSVRFFFF